MGLEGREGNPPHHRKGKREETILYSTAKEAHHDLTRKRNIASLRVTFEEHQGETGKECGYFRKMKELEIETAAWLAWIGKREGRGKRGKAYDVLVGRKERASSPRTKKKRRGERVAHYFDVRGRPF